MLRGVHYMCWYGEDWNYHPSMPMKRLQQIQDMVDVGGNVLLWSCLGSGSIGLPYLDREANEEVPPRLRFYGFLNDREFCEECAKRGITAYAVIWKAQVWEFPAEFNDDCSRLLAFNKLRDAGNRGWLGMREMSKGSYPALFKPMDHYFPGGLFNSDGERVEDFLEEFRCQTLDGKPILSAWVMVPEHDHKCYMPCANNPTYMQYIKREVEMMVDAGAGGILIDEPETQLIALIQSGCFCKDCIKGFREYLKSHPCPESEGLDLDSFDYRRFLKAEGYRDDNLLTAPGSVPLIRQFLDFNLMGMERAVAEIAAHAKEYSAARRGKPIPVTANMYDCLPYSALVRKYCDTICGEKDNIKLRQDGAYRFGFAFMQGKEGSFVQDPNEHILRIVEDIKDGRNDAYILLMLEPLAHGFNIAIPYGAWLKNLTKDSFTPDMRVEREMGGWLKEHEYLFTNSFEARTALVYHHRSALELDLERMLRMRPNENVQPFRTFPTFHDLAQSLCDGHVLFNVLFVSEDQPLTPERLEGYHTVILPDACRLSDSEADIVLDWAAVHGRAAVLGEAHPKLEGLRFDDTKPSEMRDWILQGGQPVVAEDVPQVGMSLHKTDKGYALHLVNYNFDDVRRCVEPVPAMSFKLSFQPESVRVHTFPKSDTKAQIEGDVLRLTDIGLYTVVELQL